jgi:hypothetical protein
MAVGKGGDVAKFQSVDELKKSVQPVVASAQAIGGDNDTATLIKAIHSRAKSHGEFLINPMDIPS